MLITEDVNNNEEDSREEEVMIERILDAHKKLVQEVVTSRKKMVNILHVTLIPMIASTLKKSFQTAKN